MTELGKIEFKADRPARFVGESIGSAVRRAAIELGQCETPMLDSRVLMKWSTGLDDSAMIAQEHRRLTAREAASFAESIDRRCNREPISYIVGEREFWGLTFKCRSPVLTPRPDTETLLDLALEIWGDRKPRKILDLGCGSGALLIAALHIWRDALGVGIDRSEDAVDLATENAAKLAVADRANFRVQDWRDLAEAGAMGEFDLILCNPPYISSTSRNALPPEVAFFEDPGALFADDDGLSAYFEVVCAARGLLRSGGAFVLELGQGQQAAVAAICASSFPEAHIAVRRDLSGIERALAVIGPSSKKALQ
ncbi:MAG: peptide chain release factor N(5)-glutamine methyltransferase [Alphaproteobacteria bacterium]|nr:peptide chain release factor N(5)-glutamine methyltransferase [Alphaproteobacteria bacterium]